MPRRVLILGSDALEHELEGILKDLGLLGQAVNIEVVNLAESSTTYRLQVLERANAGIDNFRRVVLFVSPPVPSMVGNEQRLELIPDDLKILPGRRTGRSRRVRRCR